MDNAVAAGEMNELDAKRTPVGIQTEREEPLRGLTAAMIAHLAKVERYQLKKLTERVYNRGRSRSDTSRIHNCRGIHR